MSSPEDALLFLDLDKGRGLDAQERRRLDTDARLRSGWLQYQALRALALETAPVPGEAMTREVMARCRRDVVGRRLADIAGGEDAAREILLQGSAGPGRASLWLLSLGLAAALVAGWLAWRGFGSSPWGRGTTAVPFEFPVQTPPADAALAGPREDDVSSADADADDVHDNAPVARSARLLLQQTLHAAQTRDQASPGAVSAAAAPAAHDVSVTAAPPASLTLSSESLSTASGAGGGTSPTASADAGALDIALGLPQRRAVDMRLFTPTGHLARVLAAGPFGPGTVHFLLDARDGQGRVLAPGTYYLRVTTPWFSRIEPIQIH